MVRTGSALVVFVFIATLAACGSPGSQAPTEAATQATANAEQAVAAGRGAEVEKPINDETMDHSIQDPPAAAASPASAKPSASPKATPKSAAATAKSEPKATPSPQPTPSATPTCAPEHRAAGHC